MAHLRKQTQIQRRPLRTGPRGGQQQTGRSPRERQEERLRRRGLFEIGRERSPLARDEGPERPFGVFDFRRRAEEAARAPTRPEPSVGLDQETLDLQNRLRDLVKRGEISEQMAAELFREQLFLRRQREEGPEFRTAFRRGLGLTLGPQVQAATRIAEQQIGRRGLTGSGLEQTAFQQIQAAGATQIVRSMAEFESKLQEFQLRERAAFRAGMFDFIRSMQLLSKKFEMEKVMLRLQGDIAKDQQRNQILGGIGRTLGALAFIKFTGGLGAPIAAATTTATILSGEEARA